MAAVDGKGRSVASDAVGANAGHCARGDYCPHAAPKPGASACRRLRPHRTEQRPQRNAALIRHGLRNALTPVITLLGLEAGGLLTGSIITEVIFSWPGLGCLMINAIGNRDYPLVEGCVLTFALSYVVVNAISDVVYSVVDPRIRLQRR
jgi:hypothetical protein